MSSGSIVKLYRKAVNLRMAKRLVLYNTEDASKLGINDDGILTSDRYDSAAPAIVVTADSGSIIDAAGGKALSAILQIEPKLEDGSLAPNYTGGSFVTIPSVGLSINGEVLTEVLPSGVYSGTYNPITGEFVSDTYVISHYEFTVTTSGTSSQGIKYIRFKLHEGGSILGRAVKCNRYGLIEDGQKDKIIRLVESGQLYLYDNNIDLNNTSAILEGLQLLVPLSNPVTIKLNKHDVVLKKGANIVTSDDGDVTVTYGVDTKNYIDNKFAALSAALLGG